MAQHLKVGPISDKKSWHGALKKHPRPWKRIIIIAVLRLRWIGDASILYYIPQVHDGMTTSYDKHLHRLNEPSLVQHPDRYHDTEESWTRGMEEGFQQHNEEEGNTERR